MNEMNKKKLYIWNLAKFLYSHAALQVEVQHFAEKMLHGQNVSAVEFGGAYRAPGAEG
jgi:hypothetical protein